MGAASIVTALQTLIAREVSPLEPATLTIGSIHGGTVANVIPSRVVLEGTLRTFDAELRDRLLRRLREIVVGIAQTLRLEAEVAATDGCPACVNDARMAAHMTGAARRLLGESGVSSGMRTGAADDMSLFLDAVPGCDVFVGSGESGPRAEQPAPQSRVRFRRGRARKRRRIAGAIDARLSPRHPESRASIEGNGW